jgi:hypothetical protein
MKKLLLLTVLAMLSFTEMAAQDDELHLKNGNILKGSIKEISKGRIAFKIGKKSKTYKQKEVLKVIKKNDEEYGTYEYAYRKINGIPEKSLCGKLISGKASLYITYRFIYDGNMNNRTIGSNLCTYYINIDGKDKALKVLPPSLTTPFPKKVSKYISDCSSLSQRVKKRELKYKDLKEITETYNSNCSI